MISDADKMLIIELWFHEEIFYLQYLTEQQMYADFEQMFNNAKHYNEEGSQVYKDAVTLERALRRKYGSLTRLDGSSPRTTGRGPWYV